MANLQNVLDKLASNQRVQSHLSKAKEAYQAKPFALEYRSTYESINRFGWIASLLSVVSSSLVAVSVFPNLSILLSIPIGLTLALGLEVLKAFTTKIGFRSWFKTESFSLILVASIVLYSASVALSSFGAINGYQMLESSMKHDVSTDTRIKTDSLNTYYQNEIAQAKKHAKQYFDQVSWKGKISHKNANIYNKMLDKVGTLEKQQIEDLSALKHDETQKLSEETQRLSPYKFILIALALVNELVIFFFGRFKEYYLFKSNQQLEQISQAETLTINLDSLASLGELLQLSSSSRLSLVNADHSNSIGFQMKSGQQETQNTVHSTRSTTVGKKVDKLAPRKCLNCGNTYKPSVAWQKYCKKECNHKANNFALKK